MKDPVIYTVGALIAMAVAVVYGRLGIQVNLLGRERTYYLSFLLFSVAIVGLTGCVNRIWILINPDTRYTAYIGVVSIVLLLIAGILFDRFLNKKE